MWIEFHVGGIEYEQGIEALDRLAESKSNLSYREMQGPPPTRDH